MISVIVPVYNAGEWLEPCVRSILDQSVRDLELILVDDGSTDDSSTNCDKYAREDDRIVVIHRENGGVSNARNSGIERATGEYITFVDCDDYILPGMYETLLKLIKDSKAMIAMCSVIDERESGHVLSKATGEISLFTGMEALLTLFNSMGEKSGHQETAWFSVWNKLYDANIFKADDNSSETIRFKPQTDSAEDVPVNLAAFKKLMSSAPEEKVIVYDETPYYFWRNREGSQSLLRSPAALRGGVETSMLLFDAAVELDQPHKQTGTTAALRHFYWYYTACVYAMSQTQDAERKKEYINLREEMIDLLKLLRARTAYKYAQAKFRFTVFLMIKAKKAFAAFWLLYRKIRKSA